MSEIAVAIGQAGAGTFSHEQAQQLLGAIGQDVVVICETISIGTGLNNDLPLGETFK
ncbi:MAG: hypothetical protein REI95_00090 [Oxalicibacterium faecigallinarum]|uniref:hypothetical protein n=1 Tax=Oxalicibacterium faecigallinarum TaxID=573741 RepID=UPI002809D07A|nr:hypothetical protein [Oxalicibacterium faecigallinarum]MDQ7968018.1 hypothetical protein [Oxalicibacterium faecigallinarum]